MPLPDILPSSQKKATTARHSVGLKAVKQNKSNHSSFSVGDDDMSFLSDGVSKYTYEDYRDDYRDHHSRDRMSMIEDAEDESMVSYFSNSVISTAGGSVAGSDASESVHSFANEDNRFRNQQRPISKGLSNNNNKLPNIPEERSTHDGHKRSLFDDKDQGKKVPSWRQIFLRKRQLQKDERDDVVEQASLSKPYPSSNALKSREKRSVSEGENTDEDDGLVLEDKYSPPGKSSENERAGTSHEDKDETENGTGWMSITSWFSGDEGDKAEEAQPVNAQSCEMGAGQEKEGEYYMDLAPVEGKEKVPNSYNGERITSTSITTESHGSSCSKSRQSQTKLPPVLPMPKSFMKKKKNIRDRQAQQRQRIIDTLKSEDDNSVHRDLKNNSFLENSKLNQPSSVASSDSKGFISNSTVGEQMHVSKHVFQDDTSEVSVLSFLKLPSSSRNKMDKYTLQQAVMACPSQETEITENEKIRRSSLRDIVKEVKAERMMHHSHTQIRKTVSEEKRLLEEVDKVVRRRLKALEEVENEKRKVEDTTSSFCGCSFFNG